MMDIQRLLRVGALCLTFCVLLSATSTTQTTDAPSPLSTAQTTNAPSPFDNIGNIIKLLNTSQFGSLNLSQLLKIFPMIASQNVSQLVQELVPPSSAKSIQGLLQFVPQLASQNLTQLLQYIPQIASQNISQLLQTIPELMSNTTDLMQIVQQITGNIPNIPFTPGNKHDAMSQVQNTMNIPKILTDGLASFKLTVPMLYAIGAQLESRNVSETCRDHFIGTLVGLNWTQIWAMEMIDSFGKPPAYLRSFNFEWLGDYQECKDVDATTYNGHHFRGQYCSVDIPAPSSIVGAFVPEAGGATVSFKVGMCMPDSCSNKDVKGVIQTVGGLVSPGSEYTGKVHCKSDSLTLEGGSIAVVCILALIGFIIVIGTIYDVISVQLPTRRQTDSSPKSNGVINSSYTVTETNGHVTGTNGHMQNMNGHVTDKEAIVMTSMDAVLEPKENGHAGSYDIVAQPKKPEERSAVERILLAFSAYTNGVKLLNTFQPKGAIGCINGIRFLSIAWVILGHTTLFFSGGPENSIPFTLRKVQEWTFYAYYSATVSVDSFFTLSGLLVGYLTLQQLKKCQGAKKMNWFMFYFHRFWRLTPPYMLVLMVLTGLWTKMGYGPQWPDSEDWSQTKFCRKNWWVNLLYVNNYVRQDEMCMGWSWYLADDMMFYILSPLILVPFYYNIFLGGAVASAFFLATTIAAGVIAKKHEYTALFLSIIGPRPKDSDFMKVFYFPAHTRMGPYIVGLVAGYILYRYKDQIKEKMTKVVAFLGWLLCFTIIALVIYGVYPDHGDHYLTVDQSVAYIALHRSAWAVAISWIIIACHTGYGGWIDELLSWKAFVPLGRLTYCAYLVHPIVINVYYMARERLVYMTNNEIAYLFMANVTLSFGVAFLTSLAFESPMMGLEKVIFKKEKRS